MGEKILMRIEKNWLEFKNIVNTKLIKIQFEERQNKYRLWATEGNDRYECSIRMSDPSSEDQLDFENNYKDDCNNIIAPKDSEGKIFTRAESRPLNMTTYFTSVGDSDTTIGDGKKLIFNFNNTDDDVSEPPSGYKQKLIYCSFIDTVKIKEGTIYWQNMPYDSSISLYVGVPDQGYYIKNDGTIAQNLTGDILKIDLFVNSSPMMGDCQMGDELNTESASADIPSGMMFGFLITVPDTITNIDSVRGAIQLELYRERTVIL